MSTLKVINFEPAERLDGKAHRKEDKFYRGYKLMHLAGGKIEEAVDLRLYYPASSRNTCCLWLRAGNVYASGSDYAKGYGYHRPSAAVAGAIEKAGFVLSSDISGRGDGAIVEALMAIAKHLKLKKATVIECHG